MKVIITIITATLIACNSISAQDKIIKTLFIAAGTSIPNDTRKEVSSSSQQYTHGFVSKVNYNIRYARLSLGLEASIFNAFLRNTNEVAHDGNVRGMSFTVPLSFFAVRGKKLVWSFYAAGGYSQFLLPGHRRFRPPLETRIFQPYITETIAIDVGTRLHFQVRETVILISTLNYNHNLGILSPSIALPQLTLGIGYQFHHEIGS